MIALLIESVKHPYDSLPFLSEDSASIILKELEEAGMAPPICEWKDEGQPKWYWGLREWEPEDE